METTVTSSLALDSLAVAKTQIGLEEIPRGSNWGVNVEKYLASVGLHKPEPWCMSFVYWCVNEAAKQNKTSNPLICTGGVLDQWNRLGKVYRVTNPKPGDIFIMDFGDYKGHTGFVESVTIDRIMTIEGNSNENGSRDGIMVCRKPGGRKITTIKGFIRIK